MYIYIYIYIYIYTALTSSSIIDCYCIWGQYPKP